jgi:hypothetical protein
MPVLVLIHTFWVTNSFVFEGSNRKPDYLDGAMWGPRSLTWFATPISLWFRVYVLNWLMMVNGIISPPT